MGNMSGCSSREYISALYWSGTIAPTSAEVSGVPQQIACRKREGQILTTCEFLFLAALKQGKGTLTNLEGLTCAALIFPESSASRCRSRFSFFFFLPVPSMPPRSLPPASRASSGACRSATAYLPPRATRLIRFATSPVGSQAFKAGGQLHAQKPLAVSLQTSKFRPQSARTTNAKTEAWLSPSARHERPPFGENSVDHKIPLWEIMHHASVSNR